jgi:excinuclease ABC subunit B
VILYADTVTGSMSRTIAETERRRNLQLAYNTEHDITPETIRKNIKDILSSLAEQDYVTVEPEAGSRQEDVPIDAIPRLINKLSKEMFAAARDLEFERAAELRDRIRDLESKHLRYA